MKREKKWIGVVALSALLVQVQGQAGEMAEVVTQVGQPYRVIYNSPESSDPQPAAVQAASELLYDHGDPTLQEQYMLELVNRARANPQEEAQRQGIDLNQGLSPGTLSPTPRPPLAFHPLLSDSARAHSLWMLETDTFSHTGVNGSTPQERMEAAGYVFKGSYASGENIAWAGSTGAIDLNAMTQTLHDGLFKSPGHRLNILSENFCEIGIGIKAGEFTALDSVPVRTYNALMGTQNFARSRTSLEPFILGVVYKDKNRNQFYDPGEGVSGVRVSIPGNNYYAVTSASGGYAVPYEVTGSCKVNFEAEGLITARTYRVNLTGENMHLNYSLGTPAPVAPQISEQPQSQRVIVGESVTFSVTAADTSDMSYQWLKDGAPIPLATGSTYTLEAAKTSDAGSYQVILSNFADTLTSQVAYLEVEVPTFYVRAQDVSRFYGVDNPPLTYTISNAAGLEVTPGGVPLLETTATRKSPLGTYPIYISQGTLNPLYQYEFFEGTLTVMENTDFQAPLFLSQPQSLSAYAGEGVSLSVEVTGTEPLTYQWFKDGIPLEGATSSLFAISRTRSSDAGSYQVEVTNEVGSNRSQEAVVTLLPYAFCVRADSLERPWGVNNPPLTYTLTDAAGGTPLVLPEGAPALSTPATAQSSVGVYTISISQGSLDPFHHYEFVDATLTITPITATLRYDQGNPSDQEQLVLELMNRARKDPAAEWTRLGVTVEEGSIDTAPKPPLAFHPALLQSSEGHSTWLIEEDQWSGVGANGSTPRERMTAAGYVFNDSLGWSCVESISTYGPMSPSENGTHARDWYEGLFAKSASFRSHTLEAEFNEVGVGLVEGQFDYFVVGDWHLMGTVDFASSGASRAPFVTGVVYNDLNSNSFYDIGEGVPDILVSLEGGENYAITSASGGYALPYTGTGEVEILFEGTCLKGARKFPLLLTSSNVKMDLRTSDPYETETPQASLSRDRESGKLTLTFSGQLQASRDLVHWEELSVQSPYEVPITGEERMFYRAVCF